MRGGAPVERPRGALLLDVAGTRLGAEDREVLAHPGVGGVILFRRNYAEPAQLRALTDAIHALRAPPLVVAVDHEGGRVQRLGAPLTALPPPRWVGELHDADPQAAAALQAAVGLVAGAELAALGIDVDFAPVLDAHDANHAVIGDRALHADPAVVAALAGLFLERLAAAGVLGVGKHFPGHGGCEGDTHVQTVRDHRPLDALWARDLAAYRALTRSGRLRAVMCAHVEFPAVDPRPVGFSPRWVGGILRRRLGFRGAVFSDDLTMAGAGGGPAGSGALGDRVQAALAAGCDMVLACNDRPGVEAVLAAGRVGASPGAAAIPAGAGRSRAARPAGAAYREAVAVISRHVGG